MEDSKQSINLNLTMENSDNNEPNTAKHTYDETDGSSSNAHPTLVKVEDNSVGLNGLSNKFVQDTQVSKVYAHSGTLQNIKTESVESTVTPQELWRRRHDAKLSASVEVKDSPSKYASLYKTRMPFSPTTSRPRDIRAFSDGRTSWLMNARKIRMQTAENGQRSHFRSVSQCSARNRNEEFNGILRRPRRSLDSAASTAFHTQEIMCLSPQNIGFSFLSPHASYSSFYGAPRLNGGSPSPAENFSYFDVQPKFESYQLVGDSLFVRFAEQLLDIPCGTVEGSRGIGLCVSGQKSGDLFRRVCCHMYPVSEKIVLLIGTNDVLQNIPQLEMCDTLGRLLVVLKRSVSRIVLLTLPPIPKLQLNPEHWEKIQFYNNFIRSLQDEVISVADIHHLYVTEKKACKMEMFERFYGDGQRIDLIHLNRSGLEEIHKFLLQNNFVN